MSIVDFLDFNNTCPICDKSLTLYLQWGKYMCFQGEVLNKKHLRFIPHVDFSNDVKKLNELIIDLVYRHDNWEIIASELNNDVRKPVPGKFDNISELHMFYLCNADGFKTKSYDYEINIYKGCYFRSSSDFKCEDNKIISVNESIPHAALCREDFSFKSFSDDLQKVYILSLQYELNKTQLWFYTVTDAQSKESGFKPVIFDKEMPLLNNRPDFDLDNRDKLIDRFDSWILLS